MSRTASATSAKCDEADGDVEQSRISARMWELAVPSLSTSAGGESAALSVTSSSTDTTVHDDSTPAAPTPAPPQLQSSAGIPLNPSSATQEDVEDVASETASVGDGTSGALNLDLEEKLVEAAATEPPDSALGTTDTRSAGERRRRKPNARSPRRTLPESDLGEGVGVGEREREGEVEFEGEGELPTSASKSSSVSSTEQVPSGSEAGRPADEPASGSNSFASLSGGSWRLAELASSSKRASVQPPEESEAVSDADYTSSD